VAARFVLGRESPTVGACKEFFEFVHLSSHGPVETR
jgi:hypothetical protein